MTVRAIFYRNWGRDNQTSRAVTLQMKGDGITTTIADYEFTFEE